MIKAVFETTMTEIPKNCEECTFYECRLPLKKGGVEINKAYYIKRHKNCPLIEEEEHNI